jgi:hypothetical protein
VPPVVFSTSHIESIHYCRSFWYAGTLVCWYMLACWYAGMLVRWHAGTLACWYAGMLVRWHAGTLVCARLSLFKCGCLQRVTHTGS